MPATSVVYSCEGYPVLAGCRTSTVPAAAVAPSPYDTCDYVHLVAGTDYQPGDLPILGSPWFCRQLSTSTLPTTGASPWTITGLGAVFATLGTLLLAAARRPERQ
jgi:hypothetical protein